MMIMNKFQLSFFKINKKFNLNQAKNKLSNKQKMKKLKLTFRNKIKFSLLILYNYNNQINQKSNNKFIKKF